jgi:hypothetical protein
MTDTSTDNSDPTWDRLDDETAKAQLYPHEDHKEEWQQEAEEGGQSLSRYLYDLIQEARAHREADTVQSIAVYFFPTLCCPTLHVSRVHIISVSDFVDRQGQFGRVIELCQHNHEVIA